MPEIKITIDKKTWKIGMEGFGFSGRQCVKELDKLQNLLNGKLKKRLPKDTRTLKERVKI